MAIAKHDATVRWPCDTRLSTTYDDESTMDITQNVIITAYVFLIVTTSVCRVASFKAKRRSKLIRTADRRRPAALKEAQLKDMCPQIASKILIL